MRNKVEILGDTALIYMTNDLVCKVSTVDLENLDKATTQSWHGFKGKTTKSWYAKAYSPEGKTIYMHRVITDAPKGTIVDHDDKNGLNNTRDNLKVTDHRGNALNSDPVANNPSGVMGVFFDKKDQSWRAHIRINGKRIMLGQSKDLIKAIAMRRDGELKYLGHTLE